jgi:hypothetical protein
MAAWADWAAAQSFELDVRGGYAPSLGGATDTFDMDDLVGSQLFGWVDFGIRTSKWLFVGPYFSYGRASFSGLTEDDCDRPGAECSATDTRLGFQVLGHLTPKGNADFWLGAGVGYEWLTVDLADAVESVTIQMRGLEVPVLQFGVDFPVTDFFAGGPFLALAFATYSEAELEGCLEDICNAMADIDDTSSHQWVFLGVRGALVSLK